jgi:hypothetical protein
MPNQTLGSIATKAGSVREETWNARFTAMLVGGSRADFTKSEGPPRL